MLDNIFFELSIAFGLTVITGFIARLFKQPLIIAYIISGILAGPLFFKIISPDATYSQAFSEIGVVFLLFLVGVNLRFSELKKMGSSVAIAAVAQFVFTTVVGALILLVLGLQKTNALYLAIALTFSSTIIIVKFLNDKHDSETVYGRHIIGLMLVQDIIAIIIMMLITSFAPGQSVVSTVILLLARLIGLIIFVYISSRFILPKILNSVADSGEFLFIFTIAWCFGGAAIMHLAGLPLEMGAIAAGLALGSSPFQAEIASRIKPLRDFFLVIFFIILGSQMDISRLFDSLGIGIILSMFILIGNPIILYFIFRTLKFTRRNSFLVSLIAAQVSEFGFVLIFTGQELGYLSGAEVPIFTFVALTTIFVSSYLMNYNQQIYDFLLPVFRLFGADRYQQKENSVDPAEAWIFGYHRLGWKIAEALKKKKISFAVVDFNPSTIKKLQDQGTEAIFGDAADIEFLSALPLEKAKVIISTFPGLDDEKTLVTHIRSRNKKAHIMATLTQPEDMHELYKAGADYVMIPHLLSGAWFAEVLASQNWNKKTFNTLKKNQAEEIKLRFVHESK